MQQIIVLMGFKCKSRESMGQVKAPRMPDAVPRTEIMARAGDDIARWVLAKRMETPETVAMASERRNQEARKRMMSVRRWARVMVR